MFRSAFLFIVFSFPFLVINADDNFCRKCEVMREYHAKNPSKYTFYDDYLKDLEEKGEEAVNPRFEDLPEDVQLIVNPERASQKSH